MPNKLYQVLQAAFIKDTGLKVGSQVRVGCRPTFPLLGWNDWTKGMNDYLNQEYSVHAIGANGIYLDKANTFYFPFFILEIISIEPVVKPKIIPINGDCSIKVSNKNVSLHVAGTIQYIDLAKFDEIVSQVNKFRKKELYFTDIEIGQKFRTENGTIYFTKVSETQYQLGAGPLTTWRWPDNVVKL